MQEIDTLKNNVDYHHTINPVTCLVNVAVRELSRYLSYHPIAIRPGIRVLLRDYDRIEWVVPKEYEGRVIAIQHPTPTNDITVIIKLYNGEFPYDCLICDWKDVEFIQRQLTPD